MHHRALTIGLSLASISAVALLWFVAVVRRRVGEREDRFFATVIQVVFVASAATIFLRTDVLPDWVGYLGYLTAVVRFVVPIVSAPLGIAMPVFVLVVSVVILALGRRF